MVIERNLPWWLPRLLVPDVSVKTFYSLDATYWKTRGIRTLLLDVDDTLVAKGDHSFTMSVALREWLTAMRAEGITIILFSNGGFARVEEWGRFLDVPAFALVGKPFPYAFQRVLLRYNILPQHIAMIGDQVFTDVLGANMMGVYSVLVDPLSAGAVHTRVLRKLENHFRTHYIP